MSQQAILEYIKSKFIDDSTIAALWLYGSRARGTQNNYSDYDIAVLYSNYIKEPLERRLQPELLGISLSSELKVDISVVDVQGAPLPLVYTIMKDNHLLVDNNVLKRMEFERIFMAKWELDYQYNKAKYA